MYPADAKILIVDDSNFSRAGLVKSMKELGYWKLLEAESGEHAQRLLAEDEQKKDPVALVISDLNMPVMSGVELIKWIRAQELWKGLPVIVLTSSHDKTVILEVGKLAVSHFIIKPYDMAVLKDRLLSTWTKQGQKWMASFKQST